MEEKNKTARRLSGIYGIIHAISCPHHGLAALGLKLSLMPAAITPIVSIPHDFLTHQVFEPIYEYFLEESQEIHEHHAGCLHNLEEEIQESRIHKYAHHTTDTVGWGTLGYFGISFGRKTYRKYRKH